MLLETTFSQLAASEQYIVLWSFIHFLNVFEIWIGQSESSTFVLWVCIWNHLLPFPASVPGCGGGRSHMKVHERWNYGNGPALRLQVAPSARFLLGPQPFLLGSPTSVESGLHRRKAIQRVSLKHATTKKGATRTESLCVFTYNCGQRNPPFGIK